MRETYWQQFMSSGRIDDYLKYKMRKEDESPAKEDVSKNILQADMCPPHGMRAGKMYGMPGAAGCGKGTM